MLWYPGDGDSHSLFSGTDPMMVWLATRLTCNTTGFTGLVPSTPTSVAQRCGSRARGARAPHCAEGRDGGGLCIYIAGASQELARIGLISFRRQREKLLTKR